MFQSIMIETPLSTFKKALIGKSFDDILRKGKWLIFSIGEYYLCSHLRMEGKYYIKDKDEELSKHEHVTFTFKDGLQLRYHDTRKFGRMYLVKKEDLNQVKEIQRLGIEPMKGSLTKEYLYSKVHNRNVAIKSLLLDQSIIAGLGNIYANEVLFAAKINPHRLGSSLSLDDVERIVSSSISIISEAIKMGGTTIRSYTSSLGVTGRFQQNLFVHKREGELCKVCSSPIVMEYIGGRSTYYCPKCQK